MDLNKKSWHARIFKAFYPNTRLPDSLCNYFWATMIATILIIPAYPAIIINLIWKEAKIPSFIGLCTTILSFVIGYMSIISTNHIAHIFTVHLIGMLVLIIFALLAGGIISLISYINNKLVDYQENKELSENKNIFIEYIKGVKGKYCPHIKWK